MRRRTRRNAPLTDAQASALRSILSAHSAAPAAVKTNPRKKAVRRKAKKGHSKKRCISASLRRKLIANLCKARAAKARKARRHSRR